MLDSGFLRGFLTLFLIPAVFAGMVFPEVLFGMTVLKNKQHPVARMHLDMMNTVLRMNASQSSGNQFFQNVLGDLLRGAVRLAPVIECAANPDRRGIRRAQPCDLVPIFLSADMRTLCSVKLENPEKVTKLLDILEEGEDIPMVFIPGEETGIGEYVDQLGETGNNT